MNVLATIIACYGLVDNSPAVVIGAMLIAMLLGPISGIALGLVEGNNGLVRMASGSLAAGASVVYGTAFLFGAVHRFLPLTSELYARTTPSLIDLMIALSGGAAGAYAMTSDGLNVALVGVAVATALVPPLASSAICLARGEYGLSAGAALLAFANMVAIQLASSLVMWLRGYRGQAPFVRAGQMLRRNVASVCILVSLAVLLGINFQRLIRNEIYEAAVRAALDAGTAMHPGAFLADVRLRRDIGRTIVTAVYRTPVPFTPGDVGVLERTLPVGRSPVELRIRSVPVTIASKDGYLNSAEWGDDVEATR
jgi:uncharacterized hydrophobic protein (TIGR00271 family)